MRRFPGGEERPIDDVIVTTGVDKNCDISFTNAHSLMRKRIKRSGWGSNRCESHVLIHRDRPHASASVDELDRGWELKGGADE